MRQWQWEARRVDGAGASVFPPQHCARGVRDGFSRSRRAGASRDAAGRAPGPISGPGFHPLMRLRSDVANRFRHIWGYILGRYTERPNR